MTFIWETYNRSWLESAMQRGDDIIIWSDPTLKNNLIREFKVEGTWDKSFYGREIEFIQNNASKYGYDYSKGMNLGTFLK